MRDRLTAVLTPLGLVALVLLLSAFIVGPLMGQTVTLAGDSAKIGFSVTVPRVHDTTTVHDTVRVTIRDTVRIVPPVLRVDTAGTSRVAGDTTYTLRQIVTLRGYADTAKSQTFTVAVHLLAADSVRLLNWGLASYDTTHWVTGNFKVFPLTMPGWVNMRWLLNGKQVATSSQVAHYSTARFARPANGTYQLVGCARVQNQLATTPEVCSPPVPLVIGVVATTPPPPDTTVATAPPPPTTVDSTKPLAVLGLAQLATDSTVEVPLWIQRPAGAHIAVDVEVIPTSQTSPWVAPAGPAYPALLMADTLAARSYPGGMGPICPYGAAGGGSVPCVRANNVTAAELDRGIVLTIEAPPPGTSKMLTACAVVYQGSLTPTDLFTHQYDNVPGASYCSPIASYQRPAVP